uniref:Uncharacterized protein n=1 Tax=Rhizophora mucronata TaxID=61149 RepID=A0A2P2NZ75_RHIMU
MFRHKLIYCYSGERFPKICIDFKII